jgi:hypothetical protein
VLAAGLADDELHLDRLARGGQQLLDLREAAVLERQGLAVELVGDRLGLFAGVVQVALVACLGFMIAPESVAVGGRAELAAEVALGGSLRRGVSLRPDLRCGLLALALGERLDLGLGLLGDRVLDAVAVLLLGTERLVDALLHLTDRHRALARLRIGAGLQLAHHDVTRAGAGFLQRGVRQCRCAALERLLARRAGDLAGDQARGPHLG